MNGLVAGIALMSLWVGKLWLPDSDGWSGRSLQGGREPCHESRKAEGIEDAMDGVFSSQQATMPQTSRASGPSTRGLTLLDAWPGLAHLWHCGSWRGLGVALLAAFLLNATLVTWLVWPEWFAFPVPHGLAIATILLWFFGVYEGRCARRAMAHRIAEDPHLDLFLTARTEYLRGHWGEAEQFLVRLLETSPEDVEARLLRATLLRHLGRHGEAREQLRRLQRWNRATVWNQEIRREWEQLSRTVTESTRRFSAGGPIMRNKSRETDRDRHDRGATEALRDVA